MQHKIQYLLCVFQWVSLGLANLLVFFKQVDTATLILGLLGLLLVVTRVCMRRQEKQPSAGEPGIPTGRPVPI